MKLGARDGRSGAPRPTAAGEPAGEPWKMRRRDFLVAMEAAAAASPLLFWGCSFGSGPRPRPAPGPVLPPRGAPDTWVTSVCGACPGGCGIRARVVADRLVSISGNPLHPINRGGICPLGAAAAHVAYHPDRLQGPRRRMTGTGELRPVPWNDAIETLAARLRDLRARGLTHTVAVVDGTRGVQHEAVARFLAAYGSPNHLAGRSFSDAEPSAALAALQGATGPAAYDVGAARFLLAFGPGWMEGSASPAQAARVYAAARSARKSSRIRVVSFEPRLSVSAAHADEWIPIVPGSETALALGLMHLVLREGLEDREFLDRWGFGFEWLRAIVLRDFHPDAVSERTGVPVPIIIRVARQFASTRPALAIGDSHHGPGSQPLEARMAVHALNALVGAIHVPGGVVAPAPAPTDPLPEAPADEISRRGRATNGIAGGLRASGIDALGAWLGGAGAYPINLLIAFGSDPVAALGGGERAEAALRRVPFVVSFSSFLDDTARQADLVLPEHTFLERWDDDPTFTSEGYPVIGLRQPVLKPRYDTRHPAEALADVARAVGGPTAQALPFRDFKDAVQGSLRGVHRSGRGALFDVPDAGPWVAMMEQSGWRASNFGSFDAMWDGLCSRGGWWDPTNDLGERGRAIRTPNGKIDFGPVARSLDDRGGGAAATGPASAVKAPAGFPLRLHLYPLLGAFGNRLGPLPWAQDLLGREMGEKWTLWVEIAPPDARDLGIRNGARVVVESPDSVVEARARVYEGVRPGVVAMPLGPGGSFGQTCRRAMGQNAGALARLEPLAAGREAGWSETWVRVRAS